MAAQIDEELQKSAKAKGKASGKKTNPDITVTPVAPSGGPPKPAPKPGKSRSKMETAYGKRLREDMEECEKADLSAGVAPKPKVLRIQGRRGIPRAMG